MKKGIVAEYKDTDIVITCRDCGNIFLLKSEGGVARRSPPSIEGLEVEKVDKTSGLRDQFAAAALQGLLPSFLEDDGCTPEQHRDNLVRAAYDVADAMMEERKKHL